MPDSKQLLALLFLVFAVFWLTSVMRRVIQKSVRSGAFACGVALIGWVLLRLVKWQLPFGTASRYCWYGYYAFLLALPLVLVWLAIHVGNDGQKKNSHFVFFSVSNALLFLLVITNDLHEFVFIFTESHVPETQYGYGAGYYLIFAVIAAQALFSVAVLLGKSLLSPRRRSFWALLPLVVLPLGYGIAYIQRVPFAVRSDFALVSGIYVIVLLETLMYSGLVPVNVRYRSLFSRSPLQMQIVDFAGNVCFSSAGEPLPSPAATLQLTAPVTGGEIRWQEDVSQIHKLQTQLRHAIGQLENTQRVIAQETALQKRSLRAQAQEELAGRLEAEIAEKNAQLSKMLRVTPIDTPRAALLMCYIKRRCNLFFLESDSEAVRAETLMVYIDELTEFAAYAGLKVHTSCSLTASLSARWVTVFYDFFYAALTAEIEVGGKALVERLSQDENSFSMRLMLSAQGDWVNEAAIAQAGGRLAIKNLEESVGVTLSFPKGGAV